MNRSLPKFLTILGWLVAAPCLILALRLTWEQTFLTWERGPQMVGFALAHSSLIIPLYLGLLGGVVWLVVYLIMAIYRRTTGNLLTILPAIICVISLAVINIPYSLWQRAFVSKLADSPHAAKFFIYASASGELDTLRSFNLHGVSIDIRDREGKTALHGASVAGHLKVVKYLVDNGADINAKSRWGDSPLEYAISEGHEDIAEYLVSKGAKRIRGSEEQRNKAASEIVREQMEEMERNQ